MKQIMISISLTVEDDKYNQALQHLQLDQIDKIAKDVFIESEGFKKVETFVNINDILDIVNDNTPKSTE